jgi:hypothetical protein
MGEVRLTWTGEGLLFDGQTSYGGPVSVGAEGVGVGAKPSDLLPISLAWRRRSAMSWILPIACGSSRTPSAR